MAVEIQIYMNTKWLIQNEYNKKLPYRTATSVLQQCYSIFRIMMSFLTTYHRFQPMKESPLIVKQQRSIPFSRVTPKVCIAMQINKAFCCGQLR